MEDVAYKSLRPQGREGRLRLEGRGAKGKKIIFSSFSNMLKGQAAGGPRSTFYFFLLFPISRRMPAIRHFFRHEK